MRSRVTSVAILESGPLSGIFKMLPFSDAARIRGVAFTVE